MAERIEIQTPPGKKVFFASDFHLGAPNEAISKVREEKLIRWLFSIQEEASDIFLVGDIFDFWFEYRHVVPKGYIRFIGKLAELSDKGIKFHLFTGNHDMWMFDYLEKELKTTIIRKPQEYLINGQSYLIGHGDGLGPNDRFYKILKQLFASKVCQFLFSWLHPSIGFGIAQGWSVHSRASNHDLEEVFLGDGEWLYIYIKEQEAIKHHDYYIFGHRHLPLDLKVGDVAKYINLGEWFKSYTYAVLDQQDLSLVYFEK